MTQSPSVGSSYPEHASVPGLPTSARMTEEAAFALLRDVVRDFESSSKRPFAAGIKPEMQARSRNTFSELKLGYENFREFIEAAAKADFVEVQLEGPHLCLHVPGISPAPLQSQRRSIYRDPGRGYIPSHLWRAFVDWKPEKRRFYDKSRELAIMFSSNSTTGESNDESAWRELVHANPDRFVEIQPLSFDTQVGWMKEYVATLPDSADRRMAIPILENDPRPANAFRLFLSRNSHLLAGWNAFKVGRVRDAIRTWMNDHGIDATILDVSRSGSVRVNTDRIEVRKSSVRQDLERVRLRVHAAVEKMPLAELLRLPIPVEYMIESE